MKYPLSYHQANRVSPAAKQLMLVALILTGLASVSRAENKTTKGIVSTKPATGPSIKIDAGYMVPYTEKIPGTDIEFQMVPIPPGEFLMGSPMTEAGRGEDEGPQFKVQIQPFWMGRCEVRWEEYKAFMGLYEVFKEFEARKIRPVTDDNRIDAITAPTELYEPSFTYEYGENPQQPAVTMTQYSAKQYTKWMSGVTGDFYRLPTEAEWEYACRAGTGTAYSFGDDPKKLAEYGWFVGNTDESGTQPVGKKQPNPWGLYDMHGNAAEWVLDEYSKSEYAKHTGKTLTAKQALAWPTKHYPRIVRGGSWEMTPAQCRSAARFSSDVPAWKEYDPNVPLSPWWFTNDPARGVGFRLLRSPEKLSRTEKEKFWKIDNADIASDVKDRLEEGRGVVGLVDKDLPAAIKKLEDE